MLGTRMQNETIVSSSSINRLVPKRKAYPRHAIRSVWGHNAIHRVEVRTLVNHGYRDIFRHKKRTGSGNRFLKYDDD